MQRFTISMAGVNSVDRTVTHIIAAAIEDRAGDLIRPEGLINRAEFLRNPVVLWAHQRALPPIGVCLDLQVTPERIVAVTKFATGIALAEDLFRLYEQGVLRGWSIGFVPRRASLRRARHDGRRGLDVAAWELLEYSAVPVPENAQALTLAIKSGLVVSDELMQILPPLTRTGSLSLSNGGPHR